MAIFKTRRGNGGNGEWEGTGNREWGIFKRRKPLKAGIFKAGIFIVKESLKEGIFKSRNL